MIRITRPELMELAQTFVLANTALSLFKGLRRCSAVTRLHADCTPQDLVTYFNRITAKARRNEIVVGLAYGVLAAIFLHARDAKPVNVDATRLIWGEEIREHINRVAVGTSIIHSSMPLPSPTTRAVGSHSRGGIVLRNADNDNRTDWR